MEAFLLPVAYSSADSSSLSLLEGAGSVCVGDADGDGGGGSAEADNGAFLLDFFWAGGLAGAGSLWCPPQWQRQQKQQQQQTGMRWLLCLWLGEPKMPVGWGCRLELLGVGLHHHGPVDIQLWVHAV